MNKDFLNRRIVSLTILIEARLEKVSKCHKLLHNALELPDKEFREEMILVKKELDEYLSLDFDFDLIKTHFEEIHPGFYTNLHSINTNLTYNDLRLATFIKMNLSNKEIAFLLNISLGGIKKAIQRVRKKLKLDNSVNLRSFIRSI